MNNQIKTKLQKQKQLKKKFFYGVKINLKRQNNELAQICELSSFSHIYRLYLSQICNTSGKVNL